MDKREAQHLLHEFLADLKSRSYQEWRGSMGESVQVEKTGPSGTLYQIEYDVFWDTRVGGDIMVMVSIDDGGFLSSLIPLTESFLISHEDKII